jgi:hypothetical protein
MITRILEQIKVFSIKSGNELRSWGGSVETIPGIIWVEEEIWKSEEECNFLLEQATKEWKNKYETNSLSTTCNKPTLSIYWKTIKNTETNST